MDRILKSLTDYATSLTYDHLSAETVHQVKRILIDSMGTAMGAYDAEPYRIARSYALEVSAAPGATVLGTRHRTAPELAAFANGVMVRYLDFNDTGGGVENGHPSDNIPAVLAAAEYAGASPQEAILGIVLAYEFVGCMGHENRLLKNGWDYVTYNAMSAAAGAGKVLGLNYEQMANAIALAAVANFALSQTRAGTLSMWKGAAAGNATRNGVFAAIMARRGMTGPQEAFEGARGFVRQLATLARGEPLLLPGEMGKDHAYQIQRGKLKFFPTDHEAQTAVNPVLELRKDLGGRIEDIEKVTVDTYDIAIAMAADSKDKWHPTNRETADHSIPYVLAVAFTRGDVWLDDYAEERIRDPKIHELMQKIEVRQTEECQRGFPEGQPFRIEVVTRSGKHFVREIKYGKGHWKNPMSDEDIEKKFRRLSAPVLKPDRADRILKHLWSFDEAESVRQTLELFALRK
jgi:2-methylcitrate dehydratase